MRTLAGDGTQWMSGDGTERLSSPWDVAWWGERVWVAMAGIHQLWTFDPRTGAVEVAAGTAHEGLLDGPARRGVVRPDVRARAGRRPDVARRQRDLRRCAGSTPTARWAPRWAAACSTSASATAPADQALLQHPLGVTVLPDGSVAVCDTYNGAVRRYDPATATLTTLATGLAEPSGAYVDPADPARPRGRRVRRAPADPGAARRRGTSTDGFAHTTQRPVTEVAAGVELVVTFAPPPGQKVDDRFGPASQLVVEATPPGLLREGAGRGTALTRTLVLDPHAGEGVLHVAARAASCDVEGGEGAACRMHQQDWGVPVRIVDGAPAVLTLPLGGA